MSYNIPLDSSGDVDFTGTMTANAFVGDGSGLTNLPLPSTTIDTGSDYTWTGDNTFDGTLNATIINDPTNTFVGLRVNGSEKFTVAGSYVRSWQDFIPTYDGTIELGRSTNRWEKTWSVNGSFSGNLNVESGGTQRLYNLGTEGDTDTEYGGMWWDTDAFYVGNRKSGTGANRQMNFAINGSARWAIATDGGLVPVGSRALGTNGSRPTTIFGVDGDFSGTVTTNTIESDAAAGNMFIKSSSTNPIYIGHNGALTYSFYNTTFQPQADNAVQLGTVTKRWSQGHFANVNSVNGNFTGTVTTDAIDSTGSLIVSNNGTQKLEITSSRIRPSVNFFPLNDNFVVCGQEGSRWKAVASVDGSFSGNLDIEVGGSQRVYNLGTDGDADTEYLETVVDSGVYCIRTGATGTGTTIKNVYLGTGFGGTNSQRGITVSNSEAEFNFGGTRFQIAGGQITSHAKIVPNANDTYACGEDGKRWSNVASVDGDFSGDVVMAANVDFTGLPTTDPLIAGRMWNDSGNPKISSGGGSPPP